MIKKTKRNLNIDIIRIMASLMIVTAHITSIINSRPDFFGSTFWWFNHIILNVCWLGTPFFFMISGYLLNDKKRSGLANLKHSFYRLGIPFLSFYILSNLIISKIHGSRPFMTFFSDIFLGGGNYLYFLVGLFILYLILPITQKFINHLSKIELKKVIIALLTNTGLYITGAYLMSKDGNVLNFSFIYWFLVYGFFIYGMYLKRYNNETTNKVKLLLFSVIPIIINIFVTFYTQKLYFQNYEIFYLKINNNFQSYMGITNIIASVFFFKLILNLKISQIFKFSNFIIFLSKNSYGVYLIHLIILEYFMYRTPLTIDLGPSNPAVNTVLIWICLVITSFVITFIIRKIPYVKIIVGEK